MTTALKNSDNIRVEPPEGGTLWTSPQTAHYLRIGTRALFNLRKKGFPYIQLGGAIRYDPEKVKAYLEQSPRLARQRRRNTIKNGEAL